jgi:DNA polymerase-3 subunit gamma/tau
MRDALSLLDQVIAACGGHLEEKRVRQVLGVVPAELLADILHAVDAADSRRVLEQVGQLAAEGYELAHFCGELTRYVRDLMIGRSCGGNSPLIQVPTEQRKHISELATRFSEEDLSRFFNILLRAESEMRYALVPRFHLELALMKMVHARRLASLEMLLSGLGNSAFPGKIAPVPRPAALPPTRVAPEPPRPIRPASFEKPPTEQRPPAPAISAPAPTTPAPRPPSPVATTVPAAPAAKDATLAAIISKVYGQSNFLGSCLEHVASWTCENGEATFVYSQKDSFFAELLKNREQQETLRTVCAEVLGQPVKICVRLEMQEVEARVERPNARERAERDQTVEAFRKKFDGTVLDVKDLSRE